MQNKPNLNPNAHMPNSPNGSRGTGHGSRFMQNKPNSNTQNKLKRHSAMPDSTNYQLSIINGKAQLLPNPEPNVVHGQESSIKNRASRICKTNPITPPTCLHAFTQFMQNKANFIQAKATNPLHDLRFK